MENRTVEVENMTVVITWEHDDCIDLSHLGEYASTLPTTGWFVDRQTGKLLGDDAPEPEDFDELESLSDEARERLEAEFDAAYETWDKNHGCEVLAHFLTRRYSQHVQRFFIPEQVHNWAHVPQCEVSDAHEREKNNLRMYQIHTGNKAKDLSALYSVRDYERYESHGNMWVMMWCMVEARLDGKAIGYASLHGIESDSSGEYVDQVESDLIHEALKDASEFVEKIKAVM